MHLVKKLHRHWLPLLLLTATYFATRMYHLQNLLPFTDEYMYANWARLIAQSPNTHALISLTDGQQPLYFWLLAILAKWMSPLLAVRLFSVFTGYASLLSIMLLSRQLLPRLSPYIPALLYIFSPILLWYDRLGIKDSFVVLIALQGCIWSLRLARRPTRRRALALALTLIIGVWVKSITYFFIPLTLLPALFAPPLKRHKVWLLTALAVGAAIGALLLEALLPAPVSITNKNASFLTSPSELLQFPLQLWRANLSQSLRWLSHYLSVPIMLAGAIGIWWLREYRRQLLILLAWIAFPLAIEIATAKIFFPRYFLSSYPFMLLLAAAGLKRISTFRPKLLPIIVCLALIPVLIQDWSQVHNVQTAPLAAIDRWQYLEGWPSGYGMPELVTFLNQTATQKPIRLYMENTTLLTSGLDLLLKNPNIRLLPTISVDADNLPQVMATLTPEPGTYTLLLFDHRQEFPADYPARLVAVFPKINHQSALRVFAVE